MTVSPVGACACVGPQNEEPFCPCRMKREAAREPERVGAFASLSGEIKFRSDPQRKSHDR